MIYTNLLVDTSINLPYSDRFLSMVHSILHMGIVCGLMLFHECMLQTNAVMNVQNAAYNVDSSAEVIISKTSHH